MLEDKGHACTIEAADGGFIGRLPVWLLPPPRFGLAAFSYTERICYTIADALFDSVGGSKPQGQWPALQKRAIL